MATLLHEDVMLLIIEASLQDHGGLARKAHFKNLRLVSKGVKAHAHRSYPEGVSILADKAIEQLLEKTTPLAFSAALTNAKPILGEAAALRLVHQGEGKSEPGLFDDPRWCSSASAILREARNLKKLVIVCDALPLQGLKLEESDALSILDLYAGRKEQLQGINLSQTTALREFTFLSRVGDTDDEPTFAEPLDFRLPRHLATLKLYGLGLSRDEIIALDIPSFVQLQELSFTGHLGDGRVEAMGVPRLVELRRLSLCGKGLTDEGLGEIGHGRVLEMVNLSHCELASVAALGLSRNWTIKTLDLSRNRLTNPSELGLALNRSLGKLNLSGNPLSSFRFDLDTNTTLRRLDLSHNSMDPRRLAEYARQLNTQLAQNSTLQSLRLIGCPFGNQDVRELSLRESSGLKELVLAHLAVGDEGVLPLLESLEGHGLRVRVRLEGTDVSASVKNRFKRAAA